MVGEKVMPRRIKLETVAPDGAVRNEALRIGPLSPRYPGPIVAG